MSDYVIAPPVPAALPIRGSEQMFPVRRIFCVGRNYAEHAIEMGSDPTREPPFYFTKPADAIVVLDADMPYPPATSSLHHEMELVVAIGSAGAHISVDDALKHSRTWPTRPAGPGTWAWASTSRRRWANWCRPRAWTRRAARSS